MVHPPGLSWGHSCAALTFWPDTACLLLGARLSELLCLCLTVLWITRNFSIGQHSIPWSCLPESMGEEPTSSPASLLDVESCVLSGSPKFTIFPCTVFSSL